MTDDIIERAQAERTKTWAQQELGEIRRLRDRVTFLYDAARGAGCTHDELLAK